MSNYPEQIEQTRLNVLSIRDTLKFVLDRAGQIKDGVTANVASETGPDGKPLYSNEAKRTAAIAAYLLDLDEYQQLQVTERNLRKELERADARLERLRNEFSEYKLDRREKLVAAEATA